MASRAAGGVVRDLAARLLAVAFTGFFYSRLGSRRATTEI
jgi:hypothetical protein